MCKRLMVNKHVFKAPQVAEILRVMSTHKCVVSIDSWRGRKNGYHPTFHQHMQTFP